MNVSQIAHIIANCLVFSALTDEEFLHPKAAAEIKERLATRLQAFDKAFLRELVDAFQAIAPSYPSDCQEFVRTIAQNYHLEEAITGDDAAGLPK